jgi:hypothetical protein
MHVVRTSDWLDAAKSPITREEISELIETDPELGWSSSDYVDLLERDGSTVRFPAITWMGDSSFSWEHDQILCKNPSEVQTAKLIRMANALLAIVVGDDGERYTLRRGLFGREKIETSLP